MVKIIKLIAGSMEPTMRTGAQKRSPAVWGASVNGEVVGMIYTHNGEVFVREYAANGRLLHHVFWGPKRLQAAKDWTINYFSTNR